MSRAKKGKELSVKLGNTVGTGAASFSKLKDARINVVASCCYQIGGQAHFTIIPDDIERAESVLQESKLDTLVQEVLLVKLPNEPGALATMLQDISALGISVRSAYTTTTSKKVATAVLKTDEDTTVLEVLNEMPLNVVESEALASTVTETDNEMESEAGTDIQIDVHVNDDIDDDTEVEVPREAEIPDSKSDVGQ